MKSNKSYILPLSPLDELCKDDSAKRINDFPVYKKYLDAAFKKKTINNIAVTGNFGVGKSSILQSYDASIHASGKKFLYVSLSDLAGQKEVEKKNLEYSLLCQILAGCDESLLPNSTYRLIPQRKLKKNSILVICATILFSVVAYIWVVSDKVLSIIKEGTAHSKLFAWIASNIVFIRLGFYIILGLMLAYAVFHITKYLLRCRLPIHFKFGGENAAVAADFSPSLSYIDQYIFELVYALESIAPQIDYTVIFEDFDRLGKSTCIEIFSKLREINKLVNVRLPDETRMRFIYVFSDGVFDYTRQTKFFDYCLPIIPVLSTKNVAEELELDYFNEIQIKNTYDIAKVAAQYLTDLRTIHSIINDYHIFEEVESHRNGELSNEWKKELLSFVIYKNLEPQDYDKIRENNSVVFHGANGNLVHEDLIANLKRQNYLSGECLLFVGYSKEQMKRHYSELLLSGSYERKRSSLNNDRKGLFLEIISEATQAFKDQSSLSHMEYFWRLFCGIEFVFLDYLLNRLINSEVPVESQRSILCNINGVMYNSQYKHTNDESPDVCEKSLRDLIWKFDKEVVHEVLRYLFISGYWIEGSFDWFFAMQATPPLNISDETKVCCFLRFRKELAQRQSPIPDAIDIAARNWLGLLPSGEITTHWSDMSLIEMIWMVFSLNMPLELQQVKVTINESTLPVISYLQQYSEEHYWDYKMEQRRGILLMVVQQYGRLPDGFFSQIYFSFSQHQQTSKYATPENKVRDFLWLWLQMNDERTHAKAHSSRSHRSSDPFNSITETILDKNLRKLKESAKYWLSEYLFEREMTWEADDLSFPHLIDILYPTPTAVPNHLKMMRLHVGGREMLTIDFLVYYYACNYWKYSDEKRACILLDLIKNNYWNNSLKNFNWFFAIESGSDQKRIQDLLKLMEIYNAEIPVKLNSCIRDWINNVLEQNICWNNWNIAQLIDYVYTYGIPDDIRKKALVIRNSSTGKLEKKNVDIYLRKVKFSYYWNYNQNSRLAFLKELFRNHYWSEETGENWFFYPKKPSKFESSENKVDDFLKFCYWINDGNGKYQDIEGFLRGGYMWCLTIMEGGITKDWEDDGFVYMLLTIQNKLLIEIPPELRKVVLRIAGKEEMLDLLLQKTR